MITARIKAWQDSKLARMTLSCKVMHNGKPLAGAEVKFVPEKFLGNNVKPATGKTDRNGMAMLSIQDHRAARSAGRCAGLLSRGDHQGRRENPAKYNTERSSARKSPGTPREFSEGIKFDLKY